MTKPEASEKPQWTTKQVVAFVGALALALGIGGTKAIDSAISPPTPIPVAQVTVQDIERALSKSVGFISSDIETLSKRMITDRIENATDHEELRRATLDLAREMRAMRAEQTTAIRMDKISRIAGRNAE
jgi:hypothetical protein